METRPGRVCGKGLEDGTKLRPLAAQGRRLIEEKDLRHDPPHHQFARCSSRFVGLRASAEPGLGSAEPTEHRCSNLANAHERRHDGEIASLICPDNLTSWRANTGGACAQ